jgi:hypothetical protein
MSTRIVRAGKRANRTNATVHGRRAHVRLAPQMAPRILCLALACLAFAPAAQAGERPAFIRSAGILVPGDLQNQDCRTGVCKHNENTDLTRWRGDIWFVHRTAGSQILGPNSSLRVYRSRDEGRTFRLQAIIPAPGDRDIRDPHFYFVGARMHIKAITRLPGFGIRDTGVDSISVEMHSRDGRRWTRPKEIGPVRWGFWRVVEREQILYSAAYEDGDLSVVLYSSRNGVRWTRGPLVYGVAADTPLETELAFSPSGKRMLGLVRMDGNDFEYLGHQGRARTKVCWAAEPFRRWRCPQEFRNVRLDGAVAFYWGERLFVIARKHLLGQEMRKRTALYEITGDLEGGRIRIVEHGEFPSAGDTSYAGVAPLGGSRFLVTWYSSPPRLDETWLQGLVGRTDIWKATLDLSRLGRGVKPTR